MAFDQPHLDAALGEGADLARDVEAGIGRRRLPVEQQVDSVDRLRTAEPGSEGGHCDGGSQQRPPPERKSAHSAPQLPRALIRPPVTPAVADITMPA